MQNFTNANPSVFILTFSVITDLNYLYGGISLTGYLLIILFNSTVLSTIFVNQNLHEPMYIFIASLCANGLYGSTSFFPGLLVNLFSKTQLISYPACMVQIFCMYSYGSFEMSMLTVMAYDRYVCICNPLRYFTIMTPTKAFSWIIVALVDSIITTFVLVILTVRLPLCDNVILKIYCDNWSVVRLSCIDTTVNNLYGFYIAVETLLVKPFLIMLSYVPILKVCAKSKDARAKALQTCTSQLISLVIFAANVLFEILLYRFGPTEVPYAIRVTSSVLFLVVAPLTNPLLYGMKMNAIKEKIMQWFYWKNMEASTKGN
ncbi:olfactory receptor 52K1-like [Hyperolius riggenbachi]|uniref:olfactory receptor 52K1-like n=1 Tax=Hyperolius riggenbachi TaxID=752182 RepID=UPI0035A37920